MAGIDSSFLDLGRLDQLADGNTPIHRLDPRAKLLTTGVFLVCVVSFGKYEIAGLLPFFLFPIMLGAVGNLPAGYLVKKIVLVSPFAIFIGIANPFFDRAPLVQLGPVVLSGGWISFLSIVLRFVLTVGAALVLIATTRFQDVCLALERLGMPRVMVVQLLLLHRYLFVLTDEGMRLTRARRLRSFGNRGKGMRAYASMLGQLLLRTLARAQRIHQAMLARGFTGEIHTLRSLRIGGAEVLFTLSWSALFLILRLVPVSRLVGQLLIGGGS